MAKKSEPRVTPSRDEKYMGLAWIHAAFSKDPSTQVGAQIVSSDNFPLGSGYNGPPRRMRDDQVIWDRPPKDKPDELSKYDLITHAERNAVKHSCGGDLSDATLYVTALPCPACMKMLVEEEIGKVVYYDYQSSTSSSLQNAAWREKSLEIARRGRIQVVEFEGSIAWVMDWSTKMKELGLFEV